MKKAYSIQTVFLSIVLPGMVILAVSIGGVSVFGMNRFLQSSTEDLITEILTNVDIESVFKIKIAKLRKY